MDLSTSYIAHIHEKNWVCIIQLSAFDNCPILSQVFGHRFNRSADTIIYIQKNEGYDSICLRKSLMKITNTIANIQKISLI